MLCEACKEAPAQLRRFGTRKAVCQRCFIQEFEDEVHKVICHYDLLKPKARVCIGVSGGKDSSALLHCLVTLKARYHYDIDLVMLAIDEGIVNYRDNSLTCVHRACEKYQLECKILSYEDLYEGWTMDEISKANGFKQNCLHCGIFRRQALERGAQMMNCHIIATGHNADDGAETILMNYLRGDFKRLNRCCGVSTGCICVGSKTAIGRVKPFYFSSQKEIVLYCHFLKLDYFSTECPYSETAFRGHVRTLIKELEAVDPNALRRILLSHGTKPLESSSCQQCHQQGSSQSCGRCSMPCVGPLEICQACLLVDRLNSKKKPN